MRNSGTITLFSELPPPPGHPSTFLISVVFHSALVAFIWLGWLRVTQATNVMPPLHYTVRVLQMDRPTLPLHWAPKAKSAAQTAMDQAVASQSVSARFLPAASTSPTAADSGGAASLSPSRHRFVPASTLRLPVPHTPAPQTLVQPDLPPTLLAKRVPVPKVLLWATEPSPVKLVVPPPPTEVTAARVHPSLALPNRELNVADVQVAASELPTNAALLTPSTVSPIVVQIPGVPNRIPQTTSQSAQQPASIRVMSLSDVELRKGSMVLAKINEVAPGISDAIAGNLPAISPGAVITPDRQGGAGAEGPANGAHAGTVPGQGTAEGNQGSGGKAATAVGGGGLISNRGITVGAAPAASIPGSGADAVTLIRRPPDGQFGFVVVGASLGDPDADIGDLWAGRLVYSVYLPVGLHKSWILQYSLPRAAQAAGDTTQPKAPWPYQIVRPNMDLGDLDTDAVLVHGFVNALGHFEKLTIIAPPQFAQAKFLISTLHQWLFRPASENGKAVAVEVLLMIPDESE